MNVQHHPNGSETSQGRNGHDGANAQEFVKSDVTDSTTGVKASVALSPKSREDRQLPTLAGTREGISVRSPMGIRAPQAMNGHAKQAEIQSDPRVPEAADGRIGDSSVHSRTLSRSGAAAGGRAHEQSHSRAPAPATR